MIKVLFSAKTHRGFHDVLSFPSLQYDFIHHRIFPSRILSGSLLDHRLVLNPFGAVFP